MASSPATDVPDLTTEPCQQELTAASICIQANAGTSTPTNDGLASGAASVAPGGAPAVAAGAGCRTDCWDVITFQDELPITLRSEFMMTMAFKAPNDPTFCTDASANVCNYITDMLEVQNCCCLEEQTTFANCYIQQDLGANLVPPCTSDNVVKCGDSTANDDEGGKKGDGEGLSGGMIAGIIILVILAIVSATLCVIKRRRGGRRKRQKPSREKDDDEGDDSKDHSSEGSESGSDDDESGSESESESESETDIEMGGDSGDADDSKRSWVSGIRKFFSFGDDSTLETSGRSNKQDKNRSNSNQDDDESSQGSSSLFSSKSSRSRSVSTRKSKDYSNRPPTTGTPLATIQDDEDYDSEDSEESTSSYDGSSTSSEGDEDDKTPTKMRSDDDISISSGESSDDEDESTFAPESIPSPYYTKSKMTHSTTAATASRYRTSSNNNHRIDDDDDASSSDDSSTVSSTISSTRRERSGGGYPSNKYSSKASIDTISISAGSMDSDSSSSKSSLTPTRRNNKKNRGNNHKSHNNKSDYISDLHKRASKEKTKIHSAAPDPTAHTRLHQHKGRNHHDRHPTHTDDSDIAIKTGRKHQKKGHHDHIPKNESRAIQMSGKGGNLGQELERSNRSSSYLRQSEMKYLLNRRQEIASHLQHHSHTMSYEEQEIWKKEKSKVARRIAELQVEDTKAIANQKPKRRRRSSSKDQNNEKQASMRTSSLPNDYNVSSYDDPNYTVLQHPLPAGIPSNNHDVTMIPASKVSEICNEWQYDTIKRMNRKARKIRMQY